MEHKEPKDRAHMWEQAPAAETTAAPDPNYPRHVHKAGGEYLVVNSAAEFKAAIKAGWAAQPVPLKPVPVKKSPKASRRRPAKAAAQKAVKAGRKK